MTVNIAMLNRFLLCITSLWCYVSRRRHPRAVVLTLSSYRGSAALAAEANAAFDAAESEVVAAYDAARVVTNRRHMRSHAWEMQPT